MDLYEKMPPERTDNEQRTIVLTRWDVFGWVVMFFLLMTLSFFGGYFVCFSQQPPTPIKYTYCICDNDKNIIIKRGR